MGGNESFPVPPDDNTGDHRMNDKQHAPALADALLRLEKVVGSLSPEEQKELLRLIIRDDHC